MNFIKSIRALIFVISLMVSYFINSYASSQIQQDLLFKIKTETPQWITDQISFDLKNSSSISKEMLAKTFEDYPGYMMRCTIKNGNLRVKFNKGLWYAFPIATYFIHILRELKKYLTLPDIDFLVVLDDGICQERCFVPVFGFCKKKGDRNVLLIPDYQVFHNIQEKCLLPFIDFNILDKVKTGNKLYPWNKKIPKAIWRGCCSGDYTLPIHKMPRVKLVNVSAKFPHLLDAKFTGLNDPFNEFKGKFLPIIEQINYKYQILIDGNTASWPGSYWRFHSNCLVLKQDSEYIQWYYSLLKPYVNYLPYAENIEDLPMKIQWAIDNDEKIKEIVKNANDMCAKNLTYVDLLYYFFIVINTYAKLSH